MRPMQRLFFLISFFLFANVCPAKAQNFFDLDDLVGDWYAPDGHRAFTIELAADTRVKRISKLLALKGEFSDWTGKMTSNGSAIFTRIPTASQMDPKAPEWARQMVAKEGTLHWSLGLNLRKGCSELILEGNFYAGLLEWSEETDQSGNVLKREARDTKSSGSPQEVRYTKVVIDPAFRHEPKPINISGLEVATGRDARKASITRIRKTIDNLQTELDTMDAGIVKLGEDYKKAKDRKQNGDNATADLARKVADRQEELEKVYNIPRDRQKYSTDIWQLYKALDEAKATSAARAVKLSALGDQGAKAYTARSQKIDELLEAYKNLGALESYRPIKLARIDGEDGRTLVSARLKETDEPDKDLASLGKGLETAKLAMEIVKPAKDKAWAQFKEEEQASMRDLELLTDMIKRNSKIKFGVEVGVMIAKIAKEGFQKGPPGVAMESFELLCEKAFAAGLEADKIPGADPAAIEKEVQKEFSEGIHEQSGLVPKELKEGVKEEAVSFFYGKSLALGTVIGGMDATRMQLEFEKSKLLAKAAEHYKEAANDLIKDHLKELSWQVPVALGEEGLKYYLDKQEEDLWCEYYRHEWIAKGLWVLWDKAKYTYWEEDFSEYDQLRNQMIERLKALDSRDFHYEIYPAQFPVYMQECVHLKITIVPAQPTDREFVFFGSLTADPVSGSNPGEHRYQMTVPRVDDGGAADLRIRVVQRE
jgi:hypothetical protein